ncbi:MAG: YggT family protein [Spirochaetales bacterium]|nr:YggT family protein [Spirochaetales bacterium]
MSPLQAVFQFLAAATSVYMLLIIFRVLLSWFQGRMNGKGIEILYKITDPYLNKFRNISWLRFGMLDFSPIVAIALLGLVSQIFTSLAVSGTLDPISILAYILQTIWGFIAFFINLFIILMIFRLVTLLFFSDWHHQILFSIDNILYKAVARILGFFTSKTMKFSRGLAISALILIVLRVALAFAFAYLFRFMRGL